MAKAESADPVTEDITLAQVLDRLAAIQEANQQVQKAQLKQTAPRSNTRHPGISVFNPQGQKDCPMPELKCEVHMPFPQRPADHGMDWEEVELMNLLEPGVYPVELNDGSVIRINVAGKKNHISNEIESLTWSGPPDPDTGHPTPLFNNTNKMLFPSLRGMLRQMLGEKADGVMTQATRTRKTKAGELPVSVGE